MSVLSLVRRLVATFALLAPCTAPAQARWTLRETLRIGGAESGPASFVAARAVAVDAKGRILVLERQAQDIRLFGADGKFIRTIGRLGSGPGEMRNAEGMTIDRQGRIWVRDAANARFTVFNGEGEFEKNWTMKFCWSQGFWNPRVDQQGRVIDFDCVVPQGGGRELDHVIVAYRPDLAGVDTLWRRPDCGAPELADAATWVTRSGKQTMYRTVPFAPYPIRATGPSGETWCVPNSSRYELMRLGSGVRDTIRVARNVSSVPVSKAERDSVIATFEKNGPSGLDFGRIPRTKPIIERVLIDDEGRAWVKRTTAQGVIEFDLYGSTGQQVATVVLGKYRPSTPFVVHGEHVYMVVLDEDDVHHVVRFQIEKR